MKVRTLPYPQEVRDWVRAEIPCSVLRAMFLEDINPFDIHDIVQRAIQRHIEFCDPGSNI